MNSNIKDLFTLYKGIDDLVYLQMIYPKTLTFEYNMNLDDVKVIYNNIRVLEHENKSLSQKYNSEKSSAKRMDLYIKIKKNEEEINNLLRKIGSNNGESL